MYQLHLGSSGQSWAALKLSTETKALDEVSQGYRFQSDDEKGKNLIVQKYLSF
jgi:hypothetical protein